MQQEKVIGVGGGDRKLKGEGNSQQPQQNQPPPQKCPRCDSMNTKFCYYNNYSLSQPRYFCKTCRRYWTQGGTLRNVPVGGGCRKGKRTRIDTPRSSSPSHPAEPHTQTQTQTNLTIQHMLLNTTPVLRPNKETTTTTNLGPVSGSIGGYYPTGGFLSSLTGIDHFGPHQNLGLFTTLPSFGSQYFQMGNREDLMNQPIRPNQDWNQSFININNNNPNVPDTALWSVSTSTSGGNSNNNSGSASTSMNPNQWPDLSGYGPPP